MSFKTILVHCDAGKTAIGRLEIATQLASCFESTLVGLHATPRLDIPSFAEGVDIVTFVSAYEESARATKVSSHAAFDRAVAGKALSTEWCLADGRADDLLTACSRYADLTIVGQSDGEDASTPARLPGSVALASGRPVLVVPRSGARKPVGKVAMLCWNASRESARAATDALPF